MPCAAPTGRGNDSSCARARSLPRTTGVCQGPSSGGPSCGPNGGGSQLVGRAIRMASAGSVYEAHDGAMAPMLVRGGLRGGDRDQLLVAPGPMSAFTKADRFLL